MPYSSYDERKDQQESTLQLSQEEKAFSHSNQDRPLFSVEEDLPYPRSGESSSCTINITRQRKATEGEGVSLLRWLGGNRQGKIPASQSKQRWNCLGE